MSWNKVPLSSLVELITKGTTPTSVGYDFTDSGINFIKIESINLNGTFIKNNFAKIDKKCNEALKRSQLKEGDILFSIAGALGRTAIVTKEILPANTNQALAIIRLKDSNLISKEFLIRVLTSESILNQVSLMKGGVAQQNLSLAQLKDFLIPLPSLATQKKIVAKLDAIFAEIEKATAAAEANVKNAEALFQSYLTEVFERGGKGWKETNLKDIAEYFNGLTYSPKSVSEEGTVVLRSSNVQSDKILLKDIVRVNSPIKEKLYVTSGDILMCSRNGSQRLVGKTATIGNLDERMTFGTFMMIIRSESNFFIEWFFKSDLFKRQIASGENTMINQITRYMLDDIVIPLPNIPTQKSISSKISKLYNTSQQLKLSYTKKIKELGLYRQSILKQAFNGELVKE